MKRVLWLVTSSIFLVFLLMFYHGQYHITAKNPKLSQTKSHNLKADKQFHQLDISQSQFEKDKTVDDNGVNISKLAKDKYYNQPLADEVQNIVHVMWLGEGDKTFHFSNYVSILSAWKKLKPDKIYFHFISEPSRGLWYGELQNSVPIVLCKVNLDDIFSTLQDLFPVLTRWQHRRLLPTHLHMVYKLLTLYQYGGVAMDTDIIFVQSLQELSHYDVTIGREDGQRIATNILVAKQHAQFIADWLKSFIVSYKQDQQNYNSAVWPYQSYENYGAYMEADRFTTPHWTNVRTLYTTIYTNKHLLSWKSLFLIQTHFEESDFRYYNPENIKELNNLIGHVLRYIYYGSSDVISPYSPQGLSFNHTL